MFPLCCPLRWEEKKNHTDTHTKSALAQWKSNVAWWPESNSINATGENEPMTSRRVVLSHPFSLPMKRSGYSIASATRNTICDAPSPPPAKFNLQVSIRCYALCCFCSHHKLIHLFLRLIIVGLEARRSILRQDAFRVIKTWRAQWKVTKKTLNINLGLHMPFPVFKKWASVIWVLRVRFAYRHVTSLLKHFTRSGLNKTPTGCRKNVWGFAPFFSLPVS